ncbi:hypothetical protein [Butyrivibrio sp. AE3004]|uniref:hypothetical protein n=1 Tax=Butyrivibrio sp. AE3004 TaxID=1506994 RepID=UPI0004943281|nr:hypothetical protein [Butyrivibrio sp. AE3004]
MEKVKGRLRGIIFAAMMALALTAISKIEVKAATAIDVNRIYNVTIDGNKHEYTFTTPKDSITQVEAVLINETSNYDDVEVKLLVDYRQYWYGFLFPNNGKQYSDKLVFKPGQEATISLEGGYKDKQYTVAFRVIGTETANIEKENNNSASTANVIGLKNTYTGILNLADDDVDWFVFKAPKTGKYKFEVVNTETDNWCTFTAAGYKTKNKEDSKNYQLISSGDGWKKTTKIKLKKGKKYYIKLSGSSLKTCPYQIRVKKVK